MYITLKEYGITYSVKAEYRSDTQLNAQILSKLSVALVDIETGADIKLHGASTEALFKIDVPCADLPIHNGKSAMSINEFANILYSLVQGYISTVCNHNLTELNGVPWHVNGKTKDGESIPRDMAFSLMRSIPHNIHKQIDVVDLHARIFLLRHLKMELNTHSLFAYDIDSSPLAIPK